MTLTLKQLITTKMKTKKKQEKPRKNNKKKIKTKTKKQVCAKYKNKSIRKTPVNWAFNRCMRSKDPTVKCRTLPPTGWNMYRYFCD